MAMQDMKSSLNLLQSSSPASLSKSAPDSSAKKAGYRAAQTRNYAQQCQVVKGRAFYQNRNVWTDSTAQAGKALRLRTVKFGSSDYFDLLKRNPGVAQWLALGSNVDVVVDDTLVIIRE